MRERHRPSCRCGRAFPAHHSRPARVLGLSPACQDSQCTLRRSAGGKVVTTAMVSKISVITTGFRPAIAAGMGPGRPAQITPGSGLHLIAARRRAARASGAGHGQRGRQLPAWSGPSARTERGRIAGPHRQLHPAGRKARLETLRPLDRIAECGLSTQVGIMRPPPPAAGTGAPPVRELSWPGKDDTTSS